jgi:hypothetical protein
MYDKVQMSCLLSTYARKVRAALSNSLMAHSADFTSAKLGLNKLTIWNTVSQSWMQEIRWFCTVHRQNVKNNVVREGEVFSNTALVSIDLQMEATNSAKNRLAIYPPTRRHIPQWLNISQRLYEKWTIPLAAKFSAPVRTGHVAHPAYCTMGTRSLSRG